MNAGIKNYNVLVTRPKHQAEALCGLIEQQGWNAIRFPTLGIVAIQRALIKQQLNKIANYQWLIFISVNAVNFALKANNGKIDCFKRVPLAAVGKATKKALQAAGLEVDLLPETQFNTEGLLATEEMKNVYDKSCLIIRGQGGRETLANCLRERGAKVDYMEVYAREIPVYDNVDISEMLQQGTLDAITITSGEALNNLLVMINKSLHAQLLAVPLIVISRRIKVQAEKIGFKRIAVTDNPSDTAIIETAANSTIN